MTELTELLKQSSLVVMIVQILKILFIMPARVVVAVTFLVSAVIVTMAAWPFYWDPASALVLLEAAVVITIGAIGERGIIEKGLGMRMDRFAASDRAKKENK